MPGDGLIEQSAVHAIIQNRIELLKLDSASNEWLCHFLVEFCASYVSKKKKIEVETSSVLTYIRGIQSRFHELNLPVKLLDGPMFTHPQTGLVGTLINKFSEQQSAGARTKSHNILTTDDIETIFDTEYCNPSTATVFRGRLVFSVCLASGARTTELRLIEKEQFKHEVVNYKAALMNYPKVGSRSGESKNHHCGIKYVKYKPCKIPVHNIALVKRKLNFYELMQTYFEAR